MHIINANVTFEGEYETLSDFTALRNVKYFSQEDCGRVPACVSVPVCFQPCVSALCQEKGFMRFIGTVILISSKRLGLSLTVFVSVSMTTAVSLVPLSSPCAHSRPCSELSIQARDVTADLSVIQRLFISSSDIFD